jgi:hypothetical protein
MSDTILHYTLNTGRRVKQPRSPLSSRTLRSLTPLVRAGGGTLPGILAEYRCHILVREDRSAAEFDLAFRETSLLRSALCWDEGSAPSIWQPLEQQYLQLLLTSACSQPKSPNTGLCRHAPAMPREWPWLARLLQPGFFAVRASQSLTWIGDFERCLAWTILNLHGERKRPQSEETPVASRKCRPSSKRTAV